jgi:hypothetical protein
VCQQCEYDDAQRGDELEPGVGEGGDALVPQTFVVAAATLGPWGGICNGGNIKEGYKGCSLEGGTAGRIYNGWAGRHMKKKD